ncbi:MAG: hypothetical protein AB4426_01165 [Xenococcaceae cyanobacterium]
MPLFLIETTATKTTTTTNSHQRDGDRYSFWRSLSPHYNKNNIPNYLE